MVPDLLQNSVDRVKSWKIAHMIQQKQIDGRHLLCYYYGCDTESSAS